MGFRTKGLLAGFAAFLSVSSLQVVANVGYAENTPQPSNGQAVAGVPINRSEFGVNIGAWDSQMLDPTTIQTIKNLGLGVQQFPNMETWNWKTDVARNPQDGYQSWKNYKEAVSMNKWSSILQQTGTQGLYIVNYGTNTNWTGGGTAQDARDIAQYIVNHHMPVKAMVIGSEAYGNWRPNLFADKSAAKYADVAKQMAQAIHAVDPNILVGVDLTPGTYGTLSTQDLLWNQTVLQTDAPYIQFVSVHSYLNEKILSNQQLMQSLFAIPKYMQQIKSEIAQNAGPDASHIQTWITEFNPYNMEVPQSVQSVYGAAMAESMLLWISSGATQVDWWSLHGDAHQLMPNGQVNPAPDATPGTPYGVFSLAANGLGPQPPVNALFSSGEALAKLATAVGNGGTLQTAMVGDVFVGTITTPSATTSVLVNNGNHTETVSIGGQSISVAPTAYQLASGSLSQPGAAYATSLMTATTSHYQTPHVTLLSSGAPVAQAVASIQSLSTSSATQGEAVTIHGDGFGAQQGSGYVFFHDGGVNWGAPQDYYKIHVLNWSNNAITFQLPTNVGPYATAKLELGSTASFSVVRSDGQITQPVKLTIVAPVAAVVDSVQGQVASGQTVVLRGQHFGTTQGEGYVYLSNNGLNWGSATDYYKLQILKWTDSKIIVVLPTGSGPNATTPLKSGTTASFSVFLSSGAQSDIIQRQVQ